MSNDNDAVKLVSLFEGLMYPCWIFCHTSDHCNSFKRYRFLYVLMWMALANAKNHIRAYVTCAQRGRYGNQALRMQIAREGAGKETKSLGVSSLLIVARSPNRLHDDAAKRNVSYYQNRTSKSHQERGQQMLRQRRVETLSIFFDHSGSWQY